MSTELRTWDNGKRCSECCNGDRCDDPTHYDRRQCPHCQGTGWALWTDAGREDYVKYLQGWRGMSEADARAAVNLMVKTDSSAERTSA
ncbi:MAG: hypothetical protein M9929_03935 [Burkholderiaceae bacterium]|nr:hypothetical protein [Burkholderiaceae bacterium]